MESIEKGYVLINSHFASLEDFSDYFEATTQDNDPSSGVSICPSKRANLEIEVGKQTKDLSTLSVDELDKFNSKELDTFVASCEFSTIMHPSNRLELLHRYVQVLGELSQEKVSSLIQRPLQLRILLICSKFLNEKDIVGIGLII